jgi:hypothetical protein
MNKERLKIGDLVEYFETIYPKVHKLQRGIIVRKKYSGDDSDGTTFSNIYMILTTENETNWVMEEDLIKLEDLVKNEKQ